MPIHYEPIPQIESLAPTHSPISPHIIQQCKEIYFRQSLLKDYTGCGHRAMLRWIAGFDEESAMFAAYLGTAGHKVIYEIHRQRLYVHDPILLTKMFEEAFYAEMKERDQQPRIAKQYESVSEQLNAEMPWYIELLGQYQRHKPNSQFHSTIHEQFFVLVVENPKANSACMHPGTPNPHDPLHPPYLFTGQIDQGGYYEDGTFALRDIKFRDNAFKPSYQELSIDLQLTLYAAALKYGFPACLQCRPKYVTDPTLTPEVLASQPNPLRTLDYAGPCEACKKKIGTPAWPAKFVERCELIWMYDFESYKRDEFSKFMKDRVGPKVKSETSNRKIYADVINPEYEKGYKKGDMKGKGIHKSWRTPAHLQVYLADILRICDNIRNGVFYRRPSKDCHWCSHQEACVNALKIEVQDKDFAEIQTYGSEDPF